MVKIRASCRLYGENFSPRLAEERTGLRFTRKNELGDLGQSGRFRGTPIPYGSATLEAPFDTQTKPGNVSPEEWVIDVLSPCIEELRSSGATSIDLDLEVVWQDQCNLAFDAAFLRKVGRLNIGFTLSCYEGRVGESWMGENDTTEE